MFRYLRFLLPIVLLIPVLTPGVAHAEPPQRLRVSGSEPFAGTECGLAVTGVFAFSDNIVIRTVRGSDQAFLGQNNYEVTQTFNNAVTGKQLIAHSNGEFHEQRATHIEGDIWAFESVDAGVFELSDPAGNVLIRDNGVLKLRTVIDSLGDAQPSGEVLSEEFLAVHGPHVTEDRYCQIFLEHIT